MVDEAIDVLAEAHRPAQVIGEVTPGTGALTLR
jgi:hypothetical protein